MPTRQIPLISEQGIYNPDDDVGTSADYRYFVNGYFEVTDSQEPSRKYAYVKRPGFATLYSSSLTPFTNNHKIQGFATSIDRSTSIAFSNDGSANRTWYIDSNGAVADRGVAPAATGSWTNTAPVAITKLDGISYGANVYYAVTDFTKGAVVNSTGTWTEITDVDFTGLSKCTNLVGIDGYLFVGTTNNRIYSSDLNAATAWGSLDFITAADIPGRILWLARIRNFLVVFKDKSIEFFENAGNPSPGSPLEAREQLNQRIGLLHRNTIQEVSDGIIFAGTTETGMSKIFKISNMDLSIKPISTRFIEQNLAAIRIALTTSDYSVDSVASASFNGQSQAFYLNGKEFYTINIPDINAGTNYTQVYDNTLGIWTAWGTSFGTANTIDTYGFQLSQAQPGLVSGVNQTIVAFVDNTPSDASTPPRIVSYTPAVLVWYDRKYPSTQNSYPFSWTSDQFDFGSRKRKFMDSFEIHYAGDSSATPNTGSSTTISLTYKDWDYNNTSGYKVARTLYYDPGGGVRCIARRLGSFRKRSFNLSFTEIAPLRIWAIEIQYNQGETDQEG